MTVAIAMTGVFVMPCVSRAAQVAAWESLPYDYVIVDQSVVDALKAFGLNTGLRVSVDPEVTGTIQGSPSEGNARAFLDTITRANGLDWYYDGTVLTVSPQSDERRLIVQLNDQPFDQVKTRLAEMGYLDPRYGLTAQDHSTSVLVSGPPAYVSAVQQAIETEASSKISVSGNMDLIIFRGATTTHVVTH